MEPEDIDQLFRERMKGFSPAPAPDAWLRLQQKMEPPKKERTMWIYYAAASISILLLAGLFLFRNLNNVVVDPGLAVVKPVKTKTITKPEEIENKNPVLAGSGVISVKEKTEAEEKTVQSELEIKTTDKTQNRILVAATYPKNKVGLPVKESVATNPEIGPDNQVNIANKLPENQTTLAMAETKIEEPFILEVTIKPSRSGDTADEEVQDIKENLARKGTLLKNIYKQARNFKNGDPIELATLGLNTEKINSESKNIKEKINKVISL